MFGLAQTPGIRGLMSNFHGTPVSDAMSAASWLHDMALRTQQVVYYTFLSYPVACLLAKAAMPTHTHTPRALHDT